MSYEFSGEGTVLQVPLDKAEELAARIEKKYCLKSTSKTEPNLQRVSLDKPIKLEVSQKISSYPWESLSGKNLNSSLNGYWKSWALKLTPRSMLQIRALALLFREMVRKLKLKP